MKKILFIAAVMSCSIATPALAQKYSVKSIQHERITIDNRFDANPDAEAAAFVAPFKAKVDSINAPVIGTCARHMASRRPESEMSNLLSDILVWSAWHDYNENVDFAVYNMGGIRSTFTKGNVTIGDVVDVAPFENKICFLTLTGADVLELFSQIAEKGGEGVSGSIRTVSGKDGKLKSLTINGQPVDPQKTYRVATIDYLLEGNDGMLAMRKGTNVVAPADQINDTRFIIMNYIREKAAMGDAIDAQIEGRWVIEK